MKPHLSRVTLVAMDATCPELARLAVEDTLEQVSFADVLICGPENFAPGRGRYVRTEAWPDREAACRFIWYDLPKLVDSEFVLFIHHDCWVIDGSMWDDAFLNYDYVGAPWWYNDGLNVGFGTLRSLRLMRHLAKHRDRYPLVHPEDHAVSRTYRPQLEREGFRWPSEQVASRFMFECTRPAPDSRHFMFHDVFNFPAVLSGARLEQRLKLVRESAYMREKTPKLKDLAAGRKAEILPRLAGTKAAPAAEYGLDAAMMMLRAGKREEASKVLWRVVQANPKNALAWALRAQIEDDSGRPENALLHYGAALQAMPESHAIWCNSAIAAMNARMFEDSARRFERSLALEPSPEAHYSYGNLLCSLMQVDAAVAHYQAAARLGDDSNKQLAPNLGIALIAQGKWREGFQTYSKRFDAPGFPPRARLDYPKWQGEDLTGKTILLHVEQGFGDEIMSLRFAYSVKQLGARVILAVRPPMFRLARDHALGKVDHIILMYDPPPVEPDYMCPLLDVPAHIDITPATLPLKLGYLRPEDRGVALGFPPGLNVGICWASGKRDLQPHLNETARQKSVSFGELAGALAGPGVNLFSLQQTHSDDLSAFGVRDPMGGVTDFADTAWIVSQLDLVVTVDTSVAHLAGALGVPCWNLVRFDALWPWMAEGIGGTAPTCWYDSMTIYRQQKPFEWGKPLARVKADFAALLERRGAGALPLSADAA